MRKLSHSKDSRDLELLHVLMQPTRRKVLEILIKNEDLLYIKEIAKQIQESQRNTSFHLTKLAEEGFVEGEFRPIDSTNGRPAKYYRINPRVKPKIRKLVELTI